ncbi:MAG TPA: ribonuclease Y [Patescibacteria group bacterium]|nr:ribonuclease Y [Patescibacteria group bacterium]
MQYIVYIVLLVGGFFVGYWARKKKISIYDKKAESRAEKIIGEAKAKQKETLLKAQDKAFKITEEAKTEEKRRRKELDALQAKLQKREDSFSQKLLELQEKQQKLYDKVNKVEEAKEEVKQLKEKQMEKLKKIAAMTKEEAREVLFKNIEKESQEDLMARMNKLEKEADEKFEEKAKDIIASSMQRIVSSYVPEISTTNVDLPGDEMKGRVIGREGRNIRVIEQKAGVEIIVDDTPNVITISAFSPIRRQVAKRALDSLIKDGRIQPAKIEEAIDKAKKELATEIKKAGEEAMYEVGVTGFDPKLVQILGRLKFRTSYGQNALQHSIEVAHLSALLAEELGVDVTLAKKGGLLHDIGKAVDHDVKGTHPEIGGNMARKFSVNENIIPAIETHHDDHPGNLIAVVVKVADAISAARPGVRNDTYERYLQRLEELEKITNSFEGVDKSYAIQAGREVRVFVNADKVDDLNCNKMAREIAKKIEEELKYPGEIKVNLIRENRIVEYAR